MRCHGGVDEGLCQDSGNVQLIARRWACITPLVALPWKLGSYTVTFAVDAMSTQFATNRPAANHGGSFTTPSWPLVRKRTDVI